MQACEQCHVTRHPILSGRNDPVPIDVPAGSRTWPKKGECDNFRGGLNTTNSVAAPAEWTVSVDIIPGYIVYTRVYSLYQPFLPSFIRLAFCAAEKAYSDKVIRETFRKYKTKFLERLPIETLPTRLECENIISGPERSIIQDRGSK